MNRSQSEPTTFRPRPRPMSPRMAAVLAILVLPSAPSCRGSQAPAQPADWELRSYSVAPSERSRVVEALQNLLKDRGRVERSPDGRVIVLTAPSTQKQLEREVFDPLAAHKPVPVAAPASLALTYWIVLARPGKANPDAPAPANLQEIASALPEIKKASGTAEVALLERIRLSSIEGQNAQATGRTFRVNQGASTKDGLITSGIKIDGLFLPTPNQLAITFPGERDELLKTLVSLRPGQTVVLGQLGLRGVPVGLPSGVRPPGPDDTLFVILQASVEDALASK
jgi:hypothetical protein